MASIKRINLAFNLDDPKSKQVYEYLQRADKFKSATVVEAVSKTFLKEFYWENYIIERECSLAERIIESVENKVASDQKNDNQNKESLALIIEKLDVLIDKIENKSIVSTVKTEEKEQAETPSSDVDEISDDAFNSMMSIISDFG